jgi:hypothetical protein
MIKEIDIKGIRDGGAVGAAITRFSLVWEVGAAVLVSLLVLVPDIGMFSSLEEAGEGILVRQWLGGIGLLLSEKQAV